MKTIFKPHEGAQTLALSLDDSVKWILFGGSRGGGKSITGQAWMLRRAATPNMVGIVIRRNYSDLRAWIEEARIMMPNAKVSGKPAVFKFENGSKIYCGHLGDSQAVESYIGLNIDSLLIEELTQIATPELFLKLCSSVRSTKDELRPQIFCTTNPGGNLHSFCKGFWRIGEKPANKAWRCPDLGDLKIYIPCTIQSNPTLMEKDPGYFKFLDNLQEPLRSQWLLGDWENMAGAYFHEWNSDRHVVTIDKAKKLGFDLVNGNNFIGIDWGYKSYATAMFVNVDAKGNCFVFDEVSTKETHPVDFGKMIQERIGGLEITASYIDPSTYIRNPMSWRNEATQAYTDNSIATAIIGNYDNPQVPSLQAANNARVSGWRAMAAKLHYTEDKNPSLYFIQGSTPKICETLPQLMYDEKNMEDLKKCDLDHHADVLRYALTNVLNADESTEPKHRDKIFDMIDKLKHPSYKNWSFEWK